jgi:hypothetical protein
MPSANQSRSWWLLLLAFLVGILIGYYLHKPKPNKAYFNILPGGVQAAPNTGDKVEWLLEGKYSDNVYIHFLGDSPCRESGDGHRCTIADAAKGQFIYYCSDKADPNDSNAKILCLDPGIDPNSGGDGTKLRLLNSKVVYAAQEPKTSEPVAAPTTPIQIPPTNLTVVCKSNTLQVLNPSTTPPNPNTPNIKVGGLVQWNSTLSPTIKIDPNQCDGSIGGNPPSCTVKQTGDISYTIEVPKDKCTNAGPTTFHLNAVTPVKGCDF